MVLCLLLLFHLLNSRGTPPQHPQPGPTGQCPWHPGEVTSSRDFPLGIRSGEVGQGLIFHGESRGHLASCSFAFGQVVMRPARQSGLGRKAKLSPRVLQELCKEAVPRRGRAEVPAEGQHHRAHVHPGTAISVPWDIPSPERTPTSLGKERMALPRLGAGLGMALLVLLVDLGSNAAVLAEGRGCCQDVFHACCPSCCKKKT